MLSYKVEVCGYSLLMPLASLTKTIIPWEESNKYTLTKIQKSKNPTVTTRDTFSEQFNSMSAYRLCLICEFNPLPP